MSGVAKRNSSLAILTRKVNMFYNVSETNDALDLFKQYLGPVGRCLAGNPKYLNVILYTKEDGKIWYGDVAQSEEDNIMAVAKMIKKTVYVLPQWSDKSPKNGEGFHNEALAVVTP